MAARRSELSFAASAAATPLLRLLDAESAHRLAVWAAAHGLVPRERRPDPPSLQVRRRARLRMRARMHAPLRPADAAAARAQTTLWGRRFPNPLGLAAGFDKDAEGVDGLLGLGFGFVEIGSVTPLPQPGNDKPRVFRLPEARAVINRYGFNSAGLEAVAATLLERRKRVDLAAAGAPDAPPRGLLGVNLGKNKTSDAGADYGAGVAALARFADYLVVNVSSPNTPGLRALQGRAELDALLRAVLAARAALDWGGKPPPPLVLKIAPDLTPADLADVAAVALARGLDGIIVSNTTLARPPAVAALPHGAETGGLSGAPLMGPATEVLRDMYRLTRGRVPLIGAGGVASGADAYAKIRAGASLVQVRAGTGLPCLRCVCAAAHAVLCSQVYTAFAYDGPPLIPRIKGARKQCEHAFLPRCLTLPNALQRSWRPAWRRTASRAWRTRWVRTTARRPSAAASEQICTRAVLCTNVGTESCAHA